MLFKRSSTQRHCRNGRLCRWPPTASRGKKPPLTSTTSCKCPTAQPRFFGPSVRQTRRRRHGDDRSPGGLSPGGLALGHAARHAAGTQLADLRPARENHDAMRHRAGGPEERCPAAQQRGRIVCRCGGAEWPAPPPGQLGQPSVPGHGARSPLRHWQRITRQERIAGDVFARARLLLPSAPPAPSARAARASTRSSTTPPGASPSMTS